jgi:carboxyl-terminal processing protease
MENVKSKKFEKFFVPILTSFVVILVFALGFVLGRTGFKVSWENGEIKYVLKGKLTPEEQDLNFDHFWEVWNLLEQKYVDKSINKKDMYYGAIKGMVAGLNDPATRFFTPEETTEYELDKSGKLEGIGIELGYMDSEAIIKRLIEDSPALKSGLHAGDIIRKVDGEDTIGLTLSDIAKKIRGEAGTKVKLTISRNEGEQEFEVQRAQIYVKSISWEKLDDGVIEISLRRFTEDNFTDFMILWDKVVQEVAAENPKGIIIDLRGNGGGFLDGAVYIAEDFLPKGDTVLFIQNREGISESKKVTRGGAFLKIPVVMLVDSGTASASEIFAGALQYYKRALIIGEKTYGKGTAQDVLSPVSWEGASIHITTQRWLLPNKRWIKNDDPIQPDIEVTMTIEQIKKGDDIQLKKAEEEIQKQLQ